MKVIGSPEVTALVERHATGLLDSNWDDRSLRYGVHDVMNGEYMDARTFLLS